VLQPVCLSVCLSGRHVPLIHLKLESHRNINFSGDVDNWESKFEIKGQRLRSLETKM